MEVVLTVSGSPHAGKSELCRMLHELLKNEYGIESEVVTNDGNELSHIQNVDFSKIRLKIVEKTDDIQLGLFPIT